MNHNYFWLTEAEFERLGPLLLTDTRGKPRVDDRWAAAERNSNADRLVIAVRVAMSDHFARQWLAGLFLGTLRYNAHYC